MKHYSTKKAGAAAAAAKKKRVIKIRQARSYTEAFKLPTHLY